MIWLGAIFAFYWFEPNRNPRAGTWEMDLNEELFSFSSQAAGILGVQPQALRLTELLQCMGYSGDRDAFLEALHRARKSGSR